MLSISWLHFSIGISVWLGWGALESGTKLLKTLCGQHEYVRIVSTDHTMVIELNLVGDDIPGKRFFEGRYYQCKSSWQQELP